ncbi:hypothetical protein V9K92_06310 [Phyllobacterium sp. CCNWLW109]|uniref:hypothetical protein n=1 Tax=Phyllobacterium sp. CCNWLW109 TaxID=3127479 RepID=UPI0030789D61
MTNAPYENNVAINIPSLASTSHESLATMTTPQVYDFLLEVVCVAPMDSRSDADGNPIESFPKTHQGRVAEAFNDGIMEGITAMAVAIWGEETVNTVLDLLDSPEEIAKDMVQRAEIDAATAAKSAHN